jgi:hypothetical protein
MPLVTVALVALLAASALAIDAGLLWTARTQLQGTVDAAALAAGASLIDPAGPAVTASDAIASASSVALANTAVPEDSVVLDAVRIGRWDSTSRNFSTAIDATDPDQVNAIDVVARLDGNPNDAVPAVMARVLGRDSFTVSAQATAWLGFAGNAQPGEVDLPVAIDCCAIRGPSCDQDFCDTVGSSPPSLCALETAAEMVHYSGLPQDDEPEPISCLDFEGTTVQHACFTNFGPPGSNTNVPEMRDLIQDGNATELASGIDIELNNGDMTPLFSEIITRFEAEGSDRYEPLDDLKDSWVVRLPVVSCQQGVPPCGQGEVRGFVCFELRQIERNPDKELRGRFLCPNRDPELFRECVLAGSAPGGSDFGIRAEIPVLVR